MFDYTQEEKRIAKEKYFESETSYKIIIFPKKQKQKYLCLLHLKELFDKNLKYNEKEVNSILEKVYPDYVMVRRYLVDYQILNRELDGSSYWLN